MRRLTFVLAVLAGPALAEEPIAYDACDELWFQRNQIYANAGHCFASPLGKAIFDNAGCTPDDVTLSRFHQALVEAYQAEERINGCAVDTSVVRPLAVPDLEARRAEPWLGGEASPSMCIGWQGGAFALHAEPDAGAPVVARISGGENLAIIVTTEAGGATWYYYYVMEGSELLAEGWGAQDWDEALCAANAG